MSQEEIPFFFPFLRDDTIHLFSLIHAFGQDMVNEQWHQSVSAVACRGLLEKVFDSGFFHLFNFFFKCGFTFAVVVNKRCLTVCAYLMFELFSKEGVRRILLYCQDPLYVFDANILL